ncbi:fused response regulator/phosphatase [Sulfurimonas sp.]|nr:fused response regulator/phosphatase [Sulfurimonas sp.]
MITTITDTNEEVLEYIKSLTVLCVEDDLTTMLIYQTIFDDLVNKVIYCKNGEEGYSGFLENEVDIIVTDYSMPVLNGIDMIKKIREVNSEIPIILVSSLEDVAVMSEAISLEINSFIRKPVVVSNITNAIAKTSKILIADKYLEEQRNKKILDLEEKEKYSSYQEDLSFAKEVNILRNDFYYQLVEMNYPAMLDFMYKPLDVVSGDAYSARKLDQDKTLYLIIDGMGKGLSASLSSMLMTSFINHTIDITTDIDLTQIISKSLAYIKPILLEEETLSIDYVVLNSQSNTMEYAKFSMPASLLETSDQKIIRVKSNNPPMSKYTKNFEISTFDISDINKFLFYSDGMVENTTIIDDKTYEEFINDDFLHSYTREELSEKFISRIENQEDDITFIFINRLNTQETLIATKSFDSNFQELDNATIWFESVLDDINTNADMIDSVSLVFTELYMNAFEHGNLGISSKQKHRLIEDDTYISTIEALQNKCNKQITVSIHKIQCFESTYLATQISDKGDGFDTQTLNSILKNQAQNNGRGVYISKKSSSGIYYNNKGNCVLFLHKM